MCWPIGDEGRGSSHAHTPSSRRVIRTQPGRKNDMQVSYAQEWDAQNPEGAYASMVHAIGGFMGALGSIPCCFW